jgi:hypothetical protein
MILLYPKTWLARLPSMLRFAAVGATVGAVVAGACGPLHDRVSCTSSMTRTSKSSIVSRKTQTSLASVAAFVLTGCASAPPECPPEAPPVSRANDPIVCVFEGGDAQFLKRDELDADPIPMNSTPEWQRRQQEHINQGIDPEIFGPTRR